MWSSTELPRRTTFARVSHYTDPVRKYKLSQGLLEAGVDFLKVKRVRGTKDRFYVDLPFRPGAVGFYAQRICPGPVAEPHEVKVRRVIFSIPNEALSLQMDVSEETWVDHFKKAHC